MKVNDLSNELNVTNKELITFLKENGYKISSHMQTVTNEMIDLAREKVKPKTEEKDFAIKSNNKIKEETDDIKIETKTFKPDDIIPCRSVTPWKLIVPGKDKNTIYYWAYYGDVNYLTYDDLKSLRRKSCITKPKILIEDPDLCYQWRRELGDTYKYFLGVEYPEEFFDLSDEDFNRILMNAPETLKEVVKVTAMSMIKNKNYPTIQKLRIIDDILGTCLKDFI